MNFPDVFEKLNVAIGDHVQLVSRDGVVVSGRVKGTDPKAHAVQLETASGTRDVILFSEKENLLKPVEAPPAKAVPK